MENGSGDAGGVAVSEGSQVQQEELSEQTSMDAAPAKPPRESVSMNAPNCNESENNGNKAENESVEQIASVHNGESATVLVQQSTSCVVNETQNTTIVNSDDCQVLTEDKLNEVEREEEQEEQGKVVEVETEIPVEVSAQECAPTESDNTQEASEPPADNGVAEEDTANTNGPSEDVTSEPVADTNVTEVTHTESGETSQELPSGTETTSFVTTTTERRETGQTETGGEIEREIREVVTVRKVHRTQIVTEWPEGSSENTEQPKEEEEVAEKPEEKSTEQPVEAATEPVVDEQPEGSEQKEEPVEQPSEPGLVEQLQEQLESDQKLLEEIEAVDEGDIGVVRTRGKEELVTPPVEDEGKASPKSGKRGFFKFFHRKSHHRSEDESSGTDTLPKKKKDRKKKSKKKSEEEANAESAPAEQEEPPVVEGTVQEEVIEATEAEKPPETEPVFPEKSDSAPESLPDSPPESPPESPSKPDPEPEPVPLPQQTTEAVITEEQPQQTEVLVHNGSTPTSPTMAETKSPPPPLTVSATPTARTSQLLAPMHSPYDSFDIHKQGALPSPGFVVVVAIDFGTTFSGYAFSWARDMDSVHMMRKWEGGDPGVINQKTPTTLLLTPKGEFRAFGFTARDLYHDLDPVEAEQWLYFDKFKMVLHYNADLNKDTMLTAANGKQLPALTVFTHVLRFFHEHALQELSAAAETTLLNEDVRWVITVPAIWKAPAKQFMRYAAYDAGIASPDYPDQLMIALEPEAASIYVRRLRMHQLMPAKLIRRPLSPRKDEQPEPLNMDKVSDGMNIGCRYMVVDCGGGTVDITVHEMESKRGLLKEIYKATGGPYGSVGVELEFEKMLIDIFGGDFIDTFRQKRPAGWVDLMIAFESRKRAATPFKNNALNVSLPFSFIDYYKKKKGSQVESAIRRYNDKDVRWSTQGMLRLMPDAMRRLFMPTLERIKQAIGDVLNNPDVKDIKLLFLVGGFAESQVLQMEVRREFGHLLKVIIPQDVSLTILKGAVLYGLDPTVVTARRSRLTYGVGVLNRFVAGRHPTSKRVHKDGVDWCTDVFDRFVLADQSLAVGDSVLRSYTPAKSGQRVSVINIYSSEHRDARFVTEKGVRQVGTLTLDLSDMQYEGSGKRREIQTRMTFGGTEIKVSALDVASGKCVGATIDFFSK